MSDERTNDGRYSVAVPRRWWHPACPSSELGRSPRSVTFMDTPLAVFRDGAGVARAVIDRCPHRNAPLSMGKVRADGCLECPYHGWSFDGDGRCRSVPGMYDGDAASSPTRDIDAFAVCEADGFVWLWPDRGTEPDKAPFKLPTVDGRGAGEVVFAYDLDCTVHAALENALDVPHTAFLHRGLFRGTTTPKEITAVRRAVPDGLEVQYLGEPVGMGPIKRGDGSTTFDHWDRFFLPGIAQIEYRIGTTLRIVNTILHLPLSAFRTRAWFVVRFSSPLPAAVARPIVWARGVQIVRQDIKMLAAQTAQARRFGGERFTSTDLDLLGNGIWRMLRQAVRAEHDDEPDTNEDDSTIADGEPIERTVTIRV